MKILTLSTYPIDSPRHGGQHRLANIRAQFREAGHQVSSAGVLGSSQYALCEGFLSYPATKVLEQYIDNTFLMEDWAIGQWVAHDDEAFDSLASKIEPGIDLVHVEHPWLFGFARRWAAGQPDRKPLLLYGSANIEHELKRQIVHSFLGDKHARDCAARVLKCELESIRSCDLVAAVSQDDAQWIRQHARAPVVLAPNGVTRREPKLADLLAANGHSRHHKFALYCASAHPPNIFGFFEMFGQGIGCLAPNERLVVVGGAGAALRGAPQFSRTPGLAQHLFAAGEVEEGTLAGLLHLAHAFVLPITQGGGTNLKTAEALWAGRHVVATPAAMRGFEDFADAAGVTVVGDPVGFRTAIRDAMARPPLQLSEADRDARRAVLWASTLQALVEQVRQLFIPQP